MGTHRHPRPKPGVEKYSFKPVVKRLEIDEYVSRQHYWEHVDWLAAKWCREQSNTFHQSPKWVNANGEQCVRSSSSLVTVVVTDDLVFWLWLNITDALQKADHNIIVGRFANQICETSHNNVTAGFRLSREQTINPAINVSCCRDSWSQD